MFLKVIGRIKKNLPQYSIQMDGSKLAIWAGSMRMVLWIEGRVSRFSKIGGEMVPHQEVEEAIYKVLGLCPDEDLQLVVSARENIQKGEELIVVTTSDINLQDLKKALRHEGLPNLWMPQQAILLNEIPLLPTGKVNWKEIWSLTA